MHGLQSMGYNMQRHRCAALKRQRDVQLGVHAFLGLFTRAHTKLTSDSLWDSQTPPRALSSPLSPPLHYPSIPPSPTSIPVAFAIPQDPNKVAYEHWTLINGYLRGLVEERRKKNWPTLTLVTFRPSRISSPHPPFFFFFILLLSNFSKCCQSTAL